MPNVSNLLRGFDIKSFFKWNAEGIRKGKYTRAELERLALISISTNIIIWGYALLVDFFLYSTPAALWCYLLASLHSLTPFFARYIKNMSILTFLFLGTCMAQQGILSFSTGGVPSVTLVWYGVLPVIGGVLLGRRGLTVWTLLTFIMALSFIYLSDQLPQYIPDNYVPFVALFDLCAWILTVITVIGTIVKQREANEALLTQKSERINNLLRILTHDVSNSLSLIETASALYRHGRVDEKTVHRYMEKMDLASSHIQEVIDCVRSLHSAENDAQPLEVRPVSLKNCVRRCSKLLEEKLAEKKLVLKVDEASLEEQEILADPLFLNNQIIMNALTNAIKFSHKGGVIEVSAKKLGNKAALLIRDHGVGMEFEFAENLFTEKLTRSRIGTAGEKGSGFGMLILKSFMDRFGGKVKVISKKGVGTELILLFEPAPAKKSLNNFKGYDFGFSDFIVEGVESEQSY